MKKKITNRCSGHCCKELTIPMGPDELRAGYHRWLSSHGADAALLMTAQPGEARPPLYTDIHLIAPMLEYLGEKVVESMGVNPTAYVLRGEPPRKHHVYRCKLQDPKTGDCTIYEIRPAMCRDYPYKGTCDYRHCTWKKRKTKKETRAERAARKKRLLATDGELLTKAD